MGVLREGLREREGDLLFVVVEVADGVEAPRPLGVALRRLAARDEHIDELVMLVEVPPQLLERREGHVVAFVNL